MNNGVFPNRLQQYEKELEDAKQQLKNAKHLQTQIEARIDTLIDLIKEEEKHQKHKDHKHKEEKPKNKWKKMK